MAVYHPLGAWSAGIVDQLVVSGGNFVFGLIVARSASLPEFGLFALGVTLINILADIHLGLVSMPQAIHMGRQAGAARRVYTGSTLIHQLTISLVCGFLLGGGVALYDCIVGLGRPLSAMLVIISLLITLILLREYLRRLFFIENKLASAMLMDTSLVLLQGAALVLYAVTLGPLSASAAHALLGLASGVVVALFLLASRNAMTISWRRVWPDFKINYGLGRWVALNSALWSAGIYVYPWLLAAFHGSGATGLWAASMAIVSIVGTVLSGVLNVLTPRIAEAGASGGRVELRRFVLISSAKYVALAVVLSSVPLIAGERLLTSLYGVGYSGAYPVVVVLAVNGLAMAVSGCVGRGLIVAGRANWDFAVNVVAVVIVFTFGWWSTASYGPLGAALGLTFANAIGAVMRVVAFNNASKPPKGCPPESMNVGCINIP